MSEHGEVCSVSAQMFRNTDFVTPHRTVSPAAGPVRFDFQSSVMVNWVDSTKFIEISYKTT